MEEKKQLSYLSFKLGEEEFAANVSQVLEILELPAITKVPHSPNYMRGVINLRGKVLPVLDTRIKFNIDPIPDNKNTSIVVLKIEIEGKDVVLGAIVDSVEEVRDIKDEEIDSPPQMGTSYHSSFLKGMVKDNDKFIMILDINRVFSHDELVSAEITTSQVEV